MTSQSTASRAYRVVRIVILLNLFLLFPGVATAQAGPTLPEPSADALVVTDHLRGIRFTVPAATWLAQVNHIGIVLRPRSQGSASIMLFENFTQNRVLEQIYQDNHDDLLASSPDARIIKEKEAVKLAGSIDALSLKVLKPSKSIMQRHFLFIHHGVAYFMAFQAYEDKFEGYKQTFQQILDGMRFFEPLGSGLTIYDPTLKLALSIPNAAWGFNVKKDEMEIYFEDQATKKQLASVTLETSSCTAFAANLTAEGLGKKIKSRYPGSEILAPAQPIQLGKYQGLSATFRNPGGKQIHRILMVARSNMCDAMEFIVDESEFERFKADFSAILKGVQLD